MSVQNTLEFSDWLSMECVRLLKNELFIAGGFNTDYASDYTKEFAVGETIRVPLPWRPMGGEGMPYDPEPIDRRSFTITVDQTPHVHFEWDSIEQALKLTRGREKISKEILKPAMQKIRQSWELKAGQWAAINAPNVTGTLQTDPTTLGFAGAARTRLLQMGGWTGSKRTAAISPSVMEAIANAATVTTPLFHPGDEISTAFKEGYLGRNGGWEFAESMSLMQITAGTRAGACTVSGGGQSGSTLTIACTNGDTFKAGEKFSIGSVYPVNPGTLQNANSTAFQCSVGGAYGTVYTASGATIALPLSDAIVGPGDAYQNISALPSNGASITWWPGTTSPNGKTGTLSVLFNRDAFAFVPVKLANPEKGAEIASQHRDPETGLSVAFVRAFDWNERRWINRFDSLGGFGNFYVRNCAMVLAGA